VSISSVYTNPYIVENNCSITIVMIEPHIEEVSLWALESAADYVYPKESTCFLLQTSICAQKKVIEIEEKNRDGESEELSDEEAFEIVASSITSNAKPNFLKAINEGRVRMTVVDTEKYALTSCNNFKSVNRVWLNFDYWGETEFIEQDSDLILAMQKDGIICHFLHVDKWKEFAWVGAPWPTSRGNMKWHMCSSMPQAWKAFHNNKVDDLPFPPFPTEDEICSNNEVGPFGNGGISLRSRSWLRKAIRYCPLRVSGFSEEDMKATPCNTSNWDGYNEDQLFSTILRGMGAPLPSLGEASLFGTELRTPNAMMEYYKIDMETQEKMVKKRWWSPPNEKGPIELYREMLNVTKEPIISLSMHKVWGLYKGIWNTPHMQKYCPYLQQILPEQEK